MPVIQRRSRLVSFRLSEQEYLTLQNLTITEGARSISDFARSTLCEALDAGKPTGSRDRERETPLNQTLEGLVTTMGELSEVISRLSILVERKVIVEG